MSVPRPYATRCGSPPRAWGQLRASGRRARGRAVHPHGRGDNPFGFRCPQSMNGSPPRAWGQSTSAGASRCRLRFTPTGVGTIRRSSLIRRSSSVHPHGRGDNAKTSLAIGWINGSPPRAWGQFAAKNGVESQKRFTPTGVGTIAPQTKAAAGDPVHPHGRGDNSSAVDVMLR